MALITLPSYERFEVSGARVIASKKCSASLRSVLEREGLYEFAMKLVHHEMMKSLEVERDKAHKALMGLIERHDYSAYGGAPLLGIDGICIICHGSSGDRAIKNALGVAAQYAKARLNERIVEELEAVPAGVDDD